MITINRMSSHLYVLLPRNLIELLDHLWPMTFTVRFCKFFVDAVGRFIGASKYTVVLCQWVLLEDSSRFTFYVRGGMSFCGRENIV